MTGVGGTNRTTSYETTPQTLTLGQEKEVLKALSTSKPLSASEIPLENSIISTTSSFLQQSFGKLADTLFPKNAKSETKSQFSQQ